MTVQEIIDNKKNLSNENLSYLVEAAQVVKAAIDELNKIALYLLPATLSKKIQAEIGKLNRLNSEVIYQLKTTQQFHQTLVVFIEVDENYNFTINKSYVSREKFKKPVCYVTYGDENPIFVRTATPTVRVVLTELEFIIEQKIELISSVDNFRHPKFNNGKLV